jgi:hypothetical protein
MHRRQARTRAQHQQQMVVAGMGQGRGQARVEFIGLQAEQGQRLGLQRGRCAASCTMANFAGQ